MVSLNSDASAGFCANQSKIGMPRCRSKPDSPVRTEIGGQALGPGEVEAVDVLGDDDRVVHQQADAERGSVQRSLDVALA